MLISCLAQVLLLRSMGVLEGRTFSESLALEVKGAFMVQGLGCI